MPLDASLLKSNEPIGALSTVLAAGDSRSQPAAALGQALEQAVVEASIQEQAELATSLSAVGSPGASDDTCAVQAGAAHQVTHCLHYPAVIPVMSQKLCCVALFLASPTKNFVGEHS